MCATNELILNPPTPLETGAKREDWGKFNVPLRRQWGRFINVTIYCTAVAV